jgi:hypothetical protein
VSGSPLRWIGVCAVALAVAAGCTPKTAYRPPASASDCGFTAEVPCSPPPPPAPAPGPAPPATQAPPAAPANATPTAPAPQWPPPGTVVPASAAGPDKRVEIGQLLPHRACRQLGQVTGSGGGGIFTQSATKTEKAYGEIRSATLALGGDYALIDLVTTDARGITIAAHAYDCSQVPAAEATAKVPPGGGATVEERLRRLDQMKKDGLITPDEYAAKRRAIIDAL